jgi:hypothetical protein
MSCLLVVPGCSYAFVEHVPAHHAQMGYVDCTSGKAAPVLDTLGAGFEVVRSGVAIAAHDSAYESYPISRTADIAIGVGLAAVLTASAIYGYSNTSECARAKAELSTQPPQLPANVGFIGAPAAPLPGCVVDTQCKGDRVCEHGQCMEPVPASIGPAPSVAVPSTGTDASAQPQPSPTDASPPPPSAATLAPAP